ncbi:MAG: adenylate/guanylate cyclase domain-containing protein [Deltaproteobacteria bacterium]|nr:adenylate/guanylate cyclase domain-containing protein [Deltaproteobacteria bacterium]
MGITIDLLAGVSLLAAVNNFYLSGLSWFEARGLLTARLLSALTLVAAWWTLWMGLAFTELGVAEPRLVQTSQLFSGFFGPLLLLFTLAYTRVLRRLDWRAGLVMCTGLFGTVSNVLLWILDPPIYRRMAEEFIRGGKGFELGQVTDELLWYEILQRAHATELLLFTLVSSVLFARWSWKQTERRDRIDGAVIATIHVTLLVGIVATNIMPGAGYSSTGARLSPILSLPFLFLLFYFVRQRARGMARLARERESLMAYLPVSGLEQHEVGQRSTLLDALAQPRKTEAAVLFADLRAFTTYSETLPPEVLVRWVDAFFTRMSARVLAEQGMVDKLIGDAVLAVFGALPELPDPCANAVRCAEGLLAELEVLNDELPLAEGVRMRMGVGIHFGTLVAGSVGTDARRTYTVFGDTVNTASRLEGLTRELEADLLVSGEVLSRLPPDLAARFESCGARSIRGRQESIELHGMVAAGTPRA